jgi:hypothetical protein
VLDRVDAHAVDAIRLHQTLDVFAQRRHHPRVLRVHIRQRQLRVPQPALLHLSLIGEILDEALLVEVRLLSEGREGGKVDA